jgi:dipeptidyl aminopeptidase/acylaminoacyl peptidase
VPSRPRRSAKAVVSRRAPRPDDLARFRIATELRLSPDGRLAAFTVQTVAPRRDGYRHAIWLVPADGSRQARQVSIGAQHDRHPRFSPDGGALAFLSDRRLHVEDEPGRPREGKEREDATQVHLLPLDGGEARRLTDLPRGVDAFEWSPDGRRLVVVTASLAATRDEDLRRRGKDARRRPTDPPASDYRYIDRLDYMLNGEGFLYDRITHLWLVNVQTGDVRQLTGGDRPDSSPQWSPDGKRIAFVSNRTNDPDRYWISDIHAVDVASGNLTRITGGQRQLFMTPSWIPGGRSIATLGHRWPSGGGRRYDIWVFAADGSESGPDGGLNLSGRHDVMPGSTMNSDLTVGEAARLVSSGGGRWLTFTAPVDGSYELWRIAVAGGRLERLTADRHYISAFDQVGGRIVYLRSTPTNPPDVHVLERSNSPGRLTALNEEVLGELDLVEPRERWVTVDGRRIQGWLIPAGDRGQPLVTEIHGGPETLYGWSPFLEFQVLAGAGMSVFYCNPRGSEGYGEAFAVANYRDWGTGPARDVLAGVDALVAEGLADRDRLGVTGGSYGGYLTTWIVGHDDRFRAAITCRSVSDLAMLFLTGDISSAWFSELEFGVRPWEDDGILRDQSPITYASRIRTPLLIQHSENDIRATVGQAEALFTVMRTLRKPVRLMRVPEENHELTRSGTPFRRIENLVQVRDWFDHFLVRGGRRIPPPPRQRRGRYAAP